MSNLRILLFFLTVPWLFCGTAGNDKLVPRNKGRLKIVNNEELVSERSTFMEQRKPKVLIAIANMCVCQIRIPDIIDLIPRKVCNGKPVKSIMGLHPMESSISSAQKKVIPTPDYDGVDDTVGQPKVKSPGTDSKDDDELPTCLMCVCLTGSVYCEEISPDMTAVPPLPKETAYLYARFNKITKITSKDFGDIVTLRRIDLSGNLISEIEDGAFSKLTQLEELSLAENKLVKLPVLPAKLVSLNFNHNLLKTKGVKATVFKKLNKLAYLYLGDNELEAIPTLPESLRVVHLHNNNITTLTDETFCKGNSTHYIRHNMLEVRLDGNPLMLAQHPNSFICLKALPVGHYK